MLNSLGVICARGGSKGLPNKNIANILGKPLIWYSIRQASNSQMLTGCIVSTDSPEIARIAKMYAPGWVRFLRPAGLATDDAPIDGALIHAVRYAEGERETTYDYIVLLPNSSVLRTADDIDSCIRILGDSDADSVLSVIEIDHPYELMSAVGSAIVQLPEYRGMYRRQDCSKLYLANGVVRAFRRDFLINSGSIWGGKTLPYIMPWSRSIDVQCEWDLQYASEMLSLRKCRHTDY